MVNKFPIVEIFGPTIQGEGPLVGTRCSFVRFAFCDFKCNYCDTRYAWDKPGYAMMTHSDVVELLLKQDPRLRHVVLTGGNPCIQPHVGELIKFLHEVGAQVSLETQGSVWRDWVRSVDYVVVSPKLYNSGTAQAPKTVVDFIAKLTPLQPLCLKLVVFTNDDVEEAIYSYYKHFAALVDQFVFQVGSLETDTEVTLLARYKRLLGYMLNDPRLGACRILPQLHTLVWGRRRGV